MSTPEATDQANGGPAAMTTPRRPRERSLLGWILVRDELARARENAAGISSEQREYLRRAKLAFELGELALAPGNAVRSGSSAPLAANLFRQSLYWALRVQNPSSEANPETVWATASSAALGCLAATESELEQIGTALRSSFIELADGSPEAQRRTADLLRRSATRLVTNGERVLWQLEWSKLKRVVRVALVVVFAVVPIVLLLALRPEKPDLAKGKPWHTSSVLAECHPEKSECAGAQLDIIFHTKEDPSPWFEYDFGSPLAFSSLTVQNRSDYSDRAVPLVVEVSNDDKKFSEIARRTDTFSTWKPSFPTQHARYLRLRVARQSMLHLEAIKVHP